MDTSDNKNKLDLKDDAAYNIWGKNWQMPTHTQLGELKNECTWLWCSLDGVNGYKVTGPNGNYIFLPAAGFKESDNIYHPGTEFRVGEWGTYLSNQTNFWVSYAQDLCFSSAKIINETGILDDFFNGYSNGCRYQGSSIRPVFVGTTDETLQCATPTISYTSGKLVFACETEGVKYTYNYNVSTTKKTVSEGTGITLPTIQISLYATKEGYENSDVVTKEIDLSTLIGKLGDVNGDGKVSIADVTTIASMLLE